MSREEGDAEADAGERKRGEGKKRYIEVRDFSGMLRVLVFLS